MNKEQVIAEVNTANLSDINWWADIRTKMGKTYAVGYLDAKTEELGNALPSDCEEFREAILEYLDYDIWD